MSAPAVLGVDIGGTKLAVRLEAPGAAPVQVSTPWPAGGSATDDLGLLAATVAAARERRRRPIAAVGVALPATVDHAGVVRAWPGRPGWQEFDLAGPLRALGGGAPVRWADDGDLAALAEADAANAADLVYLGVGTGVGGGVVSGGRSLPGPGRGSSELGHVVVDAAGPRCDCGRRGCVQAAASGPATLRRASRLRGEPVTFDELSAGWTGGVPWACTAIEEACTALALAVVAAGELLGTKTAVLGGGVPPRLPGYVEAVAARVRELTRPAHPPPLVRAARFGGLSSLHGAVLLARSTVVTGDP
ncbi:ROK family protein [Amycolatopsis sp. cmx-4-83]|uniref:ROK family protein n=1 Tax=Amycolatopsis sp. cmx-4-83 TaxID=2790940 RepID=UPI00397A1696